MSKPIFPTLLFVLLVASGCSVDVSRVPRDTTAANLDVSPPLPPCATCLKCPQSVGPTGMVLATRRHRLEIPGGGVTTPRQAKFNEIEQDDLVGVHIQGVGQLAQPATLVLSYAGCSAELTADRQLGIRRLANIGSPWVAVPNVVHVPDSMYVRVRITDTSRYAIVAE